MQRSLAVCRQAAAAGTLVWVRTPPMLGAKCMAVTAKGPAEIYARIGPCYCHSDVQTAHGT